MYLKSYSEQARSWPTTGRHILAQFDADSIYVYQAYRPVIAEYAVAHHQFGGEFSFSRMSWIKPNFLWMMYRSGWATNEGQERVLAIKLRRPFFDELLRAAVASSFVPGRFTRREDWANAVENSEVRLQWDPDHDPAGTPLQRRALQLGLRGPALRRYATTEILAIEDVTAFVASQRAAAQGDFAQLTTPQEHVYVPSDSAASVSVGLDDSRSSTQS